MSSVIEKSRDMEKRYEQGIDTWGNRSRRLYQSIFKGAVDRVKDILLQTSPIEERPILVHWFDIGCGGGNIWDTVLENSDALCTFRVSGCDLVDTAVRDLKSRYTPTEFNRVFVSDMETVSSSDRDSEFALSVSQADVVSLVDVIYYFGEKRDYRQTLSEIWDLLPVGCIVICADSLIPYQRRSYLSTKSDCETLYSYTDYTEPVSEEVSGNRKWHRYLKVKIYRKSNPVEV